MEIRQVGTGDIRIEESEAGGFHFVTLSDADDGDVIIIDEDTLDPLIDELIKIKEFRKNSNQ